MIILDTNVLSELMKAKPSEVVVAWLARQSRKNLSTTSITKAEILYGVARLPEGRRKAALARDAERMFGEDFGHPLLSFDDAATTHYAEILNIRRRAGRPMATLDALIASIALAIDAAVATRNVADFEGCGIAVIDPWSPDS